MVVNETNLESIRTWCVVSHHIHSDDALVLLGDACEMFGVSPGGFSYEEIESRIVGDSGIPYPWNNAGGSKTYLLRRTETEVVWLESCSASASDGGVTVSTRSVALGSLSSDDALARLALGGSLLGPLAHEVNNIVQALSSAEYMFRDNALRGEPMDLEDVDDLREMAVHLRSMGSGLQRFARLQTRERGPVHLPDLMSKTVAFLRASGRLGIVKYTVECSDNLPLLQWILIDLDFIVLALMANAVDAALVSNSESWVRVEMCEGNDSIAVEILNSGPALNLADCAVPGFTSKSKHRHLGLGLSAALGVISKNGGSLEATANTVGSGILLTLPLEGRETTDDVA